MGKHGQLVMGPAGSGKSTYCSMIVRHCENIGRTVHVVNLDPAAERCNYPISIDIRELISVEEVMEELELGPNGALVYCMEYLIENIDWLTDQLNDYSDDYLLFDCPGQIEVFTHVDVMKQFVGVVERLGYRIAGVFLLDSIFVSDGSKFIAGVLACLSAMVQLEIPHLNVLSKVDLLSSKAALDSFLDMDLSLILPSLNTTSKSCRFRRLNEVMGDLIEQYAMVSFVPLDPTDDDSIAYLLSNVDVAVQYGEDLEPTEARNDDSDGEARR